MTRSFPCYYILRDRKALPTRNVMAWARMLEDRSSRTVAQTLFRNAEPWLSLDTAREHEQEVVRASLGMAKHNIIDMRMAVARVLVSTVFLGLDHSFGRGPPLLFETLVFNGPCHDDMDRYSSWDQAEAGHLAMVERVKSALVAAAVSVVSVPFE